MAVDRLGGVVGGPSPAPYAGEDRRGRTPRVASRPLLADAAALRATLLLCAATVIGVGLLLAVGAQPAAVLEGLRGLTAVGSAVAGTFALVSWRLTGQAAAAWGGCALLGRASVMLVLGLTGALWGGPMATTGPAVGVLVGALLVAGVLTRGLRAPAVEAGLRPGQIVTVAYSVAVILGAATLGGLRLAGGDSDVAAVTAAAVAAAVWTVFLLVNRPRSTRGWLAGLAVGSLAHALLTIPSLLGHTSWAWPAMLATVVATATPVTYLHAEMRRALDRQDRRDLHLSQDLATTQAMLTSEQAALQERRHDLVNALAAVRAADGTLRNYASRLDEATRRTLADAVTAELGRIEQLIDPAPDSPAEDCDLQDCLGLVVAAERNLGADVTLAVSGVRVHARPASLARVVHNLLTNCRRYAPGAPVSVSAVADGARVSLRVTDAGPGIPIPERAAVTARGVRGSASRGTPGSGLGLYVSCRLMHEMDGSLSLEDSDGVGCSVLLTLPAARTGADGSA
jgi:signal transduction histidine kinase